MALKHLRLCLQDINSVVKGARKERVVYDLGRLLLLKVAPGTQVLGVRQGEYSSKRTKDS